MMAFKRTLVVLGWPFKFLVRILGWVSGLFVVALALPFAKPVEGTEALFRDYPENGFWERVLLPKAFWMWSNDEDGALGDVRGWWDENSPFGNCRKFLSKYWWLAIRNPFNNASRLSTFFSCDIRNGDFDWYGQQHVRDDFESTGWQLVFCENKLTGKVHGGFYWVYRWGKSNRAIVVQIGNKIYPSHQFVVYDDPIDYFKGYTLEVQLWKDIS